MVNQSKSNELRFWKKWNNSRAVSAPLGKHAQLHTVFRDDLEIYHPRDWSIGELKIGGKSVYGFGNYVSGGNEPKEVLDYILSNSRFYGFTDGFVGHPIPSRKDGKEITEKLGYRAIWLQHKDNLSPQAAFDKYNQAHREAEQYRQAKAKRGGHRGISEPSSGLDTITQKEFPAVVSEYEDVRSMRGQLSIPLICIINSVYRLNREAPLDIEDPSRLKTVTPQYIVNLIENGINRVRDSPYGKSLPGFVAAETARLEQNRLLLNSLQR